MRKLVPVIALAVFAVFMVIVFLSFRPGQESATPLNLNLPEKWQEFNRSANRTGKDALGFFQNEHEKKISWKDGVVADYTDGAKTRFTIWVAGAANDGHAGQMMTDMTNKIGAAHKVFKAPAPVDLGGIKAYKTEGQGNINYYWVKGRQVYWIGVNGAADPDALAKRIAAEF